MPTSNIKKIDAYEDFRSFDDKLEVLRFSASIHSAIKDEIGSDYVLAKLTDKNKEFIIEMTTNAYFLKAIFDYMLMRLEQTKEKYTPTYYDKMISMVKKIRDTLFKSFMIKNHMIAALNRNVPSNDLLNLLVGVSPLPPEIEQPTALQQATEKLKPEVK